MQSALEFFRVARSDTAIQARLRLLDPGAGLDDLVAMAVAEGFSVTADELRAAFKADWMLRWLRAGRPTLAVPPPSTQV